MHAADRDLGDHVSANENDNDVTPDISPQGLAALRYAKLGWHVFPCWWPHLNQCACGHTDCSSPAKHPIAAAAPHGVHDATTDLDQVADWWIRWPQANVAIALGPSHLFVLDVDGPAGAHTLTRLVDQNAPLPDTLTADTGRAEGDGVHHFFAQPDPPIGNRKLVDPASKLEIKGDGGYVIAAPSCHVSGRHYVWRTTGHYDPADAPQWLLDLAAKPAPTGDIPAVPLTADGPDHIAEKRIRGLAGNLALMQPNTGRNDTLNHAAYIAGQLVGAGRLDRTHAEQILTTAALRSGLTPTETAKTIASGLESGLANPDYDHMPGAHHTIPAVTPLEIDTPTTPTPSTSWAPVDGTEYIDGTYVPPQPTQLARNDGVHLFYPGRINLLFGESEAGKGWVALHGIAQALQRGDTVLYIDFEDYPDTIYARLKLLGVTKQQLADQFAYIRPDAALDDAGRTALSATVTSLHPDLVVLDGITGAMSLHGLDTNSSTDVDQFYSLLGEPLARAGAAVVFIDHVTKSTETRGKGPIGSQHKRARVSGASFEVSTLQAIAPGRAGRLRLKIDKDRLGALRSAHPIQAGEFHLDSTDPDRARAHIAAPVDNDTPFRHTLAMQHVSEALEQVGDQGLSRRGIEDIGGFAKDTLKQAVDELIEDGYVVRETGERGALLHRLVRPYRSTTTVPEHRSTSNMSPAPSPVSPTVPEGPGTVIGTDDERHVPGPRRFIGGGRGTDDESDRRDIPPGAQEVPLK